MLNQSGVEALCSATYLDDYLDSLESLPDRMQRHVSEIRRLDSDYFDGLRKIGQLKNTLGRFNIRVNSSKSSTADSFDVGGSSSVAKPSSAVPIADRRQKRMAILKHMKYLLIQGQNMADHKLGELSSINELIETHGRRLENDSDNMQMEANDNGVSTKHSNSNHTDAASTSERPVRSIMRGFMRGEKDRFSNLSGNGHEDIHHPPRAERQSSNIGISIFAAIGSEGESEAASPSTSSSVNVFAADAATASATRQANKRPRRQKQFPDFVRELEVSISGVLNTVLPNGLSASLSSAVATGGSTSSTGTSTRSARERAASNMNVVQPANKRKKKRQKPDSSSAGGGSGKIKFNLPVDPDEPTYCLCEQVSYGEMIGCDNNDCDIEWFHFNCVGLSSKPKGKWYCPNCRGDRPNIMKQLSSKSAS